MTILAVLALLSWAMAIGEIVVTPNHTSGGLWPIVVFFSNVALAVSVLVG